jgi:hypothetical protein
MHLSLAEGVMIALAAGQLIYAALDYRNRAASMETNQRRHPTLVIALFMLFTWAAVAFDIYDRNCPSENYQMIIANLGNSPPRTYFMTINTPLLQQYRNDHKLMLLVRAVFADVDRMSDTKIEKSALYSIPIGDPLTLALVSTGKMKVAALQATQVEYDIILLPSSVSHDRVTMLSDVEPLGGKILATAGQMLMGGPPDTNTTDNQPK